MSVFNFGLEWDSVTLARTIQEQFTARHLTNVRGEKNEAGSITLGFSDKGLSAFCCEGFNLKLKWGCKVTLSNDKQNIHIIAGSFSQNATKKAKFNQNFTDLVKASKYFELVLKDYDEVLF